MKALLDVNFLIALFDAAHVHHAEAQAWLIRHPPAGLGHLPADAERMYPDLFPARLSGEPADSRNHPPPAPSHRRHRPRILGGCRLAHRSAALRPDPCAAPAPHYRRLSARAGRRPQGAARHLRSGHPPDRGCRSHVQEPPHALAAPAILRERRPTGRLRFEPARPLLPSSP